MWSGRALWAVLGGRRGVGQRWEGLCACVACGRFCLTGDVAAWRAYVVVDGGEDERGAAEVEVRCDVFT
jgi:hypothetical protein